MYKRLIITLLVVAGGLQLSAPAIAEPVTSERGAIGINEESAAGQEWQQYNKDGPPIPRDYLQQPPLIPHKVEGYQITVKHNKCLSCHSWANYKENGATKISQTHFESRDGAILSNVSARRYFCTQCHVPQTNAKPLVDNTFEAVEALRPQ
jgi:cytochrome c-type protein NapB